MAKDPAMLWYWNDWHSGTVLLSRFLKGCYIDLLHAQFNNGPLSLEEIKTCLGADFANAWLTLQKKFKQTPEGLFFNEKLEHEKQKRKDFSESRRKNIKKRYIVPTYVDTSVEHMKLHMENANENKGKDRGVGKGKEVLFTIEHCATVALNDTRWVTANKTSENELKEFNKVLERRGIYEKNPMDYKNHFANWKLGGKKDEPIKNEYSAPPLKNFNAR